MHRRELITCLVAFVLISSKKREATKAFAIFILFAQLYGDLN